MTETIKEVVERIRAEEAVKAEERIRTREAEGREKVLHIFAEESNWAFVLRRELTQTLVEFPLTGRTGWYSNEVLAPVS